MTPLIERRSRDANECAPVTRSPSQAGFTLIELMTTILCVTIIAAMAVPRVSGYLLQARLEGAKPYLMQIAARQRMYRIENGQYCCSVSDSATNEDVMAAKLGVTLSDIGDFCFVFICRSSSACQTTSGPGFITSGSGTPPDFEVWGILYDGSSSTVSGPGGITCTPAAAKAAPTGWVAARTSTAAGRTGQVVVARYPPPLNGPGATGAFSPHGGVSFTWTDGTSITDASQP